MEEKIVLEYQTISKKVPFKEWLNDLDQVNKKRIQIGINKLRLGYSGDCKYLTNSVYEKRCHFGPGYRIYYGQKDEKIIFLLCGGDKGSQK